MRRHSSPARTERVGARGRTWLASRLGNSSPRAGARSTAVNGYSERFAQLVHPCAREAPNPLSEKGGGNRFQGVQVDNACLGHGIVTGFQHHF
jgi:hypothetical protein